MNQAFMVQSLQRSTTEDEQEEEENSLGQETQGLDIRPVESGLWSDGSKSEVLVPTSVSL